ncbi:hypothetical protein HIM_02923 [Hirsutella minnesotensis 3608]|nr:hypothetical protein HIM_02923 [Hirsutella minnesotensis 3608]
MASDLQAWSRRDSWPPTQVRLNPTITKSCSDPRPLLEDIDENPLTYFLTPSVDNDTECFEDEDMIFDAGIEDSSLPREIVRSVSPSSLEGLSKTRGLAASPDFDSDGLTTDDDDEEDYIRFSPGSPSPLSSLRNMTIDGFRLRPRSPIFGRAADGLLSAASFPAARPVRGRTAARMMRPAQSRTMPVRPRPGRLWREPSPDVWSIEEETEEDVLRSQTGDAQRHEEPVVEKKAAAKPKKKVRFLLPAKE